MLASPFRVSPSLDSGRSKLRLGARLFGLGLFALPLVGLSSCGELVTEVVVDVVYEGVKCDNTAAVAAGPVGELGERPASATSTACDEETGSMGRVVITPKSDDGAEFAVEVRVRPDQGDPDTCLASNDYDGCIVARRIVSYVPGRSVTMRIDLRNPCENTPCDQETTCVARGTDKTCTTAHLDLDKCSPNCNEDSIFEQSEEEFSPCDPGFVIDSSDPTQCVDVDECETGKSNCDAHATCENTKGGFSCSCYAGYEGDGVDCTPLHCPGGCADEASCKQVNGAYQCVCDNGFLGDGQECVDLDECSASELNNCPIDSTCQNTTGSFECVCGDGFEFTASAGCVNVDECDADTDDCPAGTTCRDTDGSYECKCADGFEPSAEGCVNVDECDAGTDECPAGSTCEDTDGSYECKCPDGYELDATGCVDIDECEAHTAACPANTVCADTDGSYDCPCADGFELDATETCADIDECTTGADDCAATEECINTDGGFTCDACSPTVNLAAASSGVTVTASTTFGGYAAENAIDGNTSTVQTEAMSWCNAGGVGMPQYFTLKFPEPRTLSRLELYTSDGYVIRDYDLEYLDGSSWVPLWNQTNNTAVHLTHGFAPVTTSEFRIVARYGSASQPTYARLNEVQLFCE